MSVLKPKPNQLLTNYTTQPISKLTTLSKTKTKPITYKLDNSSNLKPRVKPKPK